MNYKEMIRNAQSKGVTDEECMWSSIEKLDNALKTLETEHPDIYWRLMRDTHEDLYGPHYDEEFAKYDVDQMHCTDREGHEHRGAWWTAGEILEATKGKTFPENTSSWDKYVAYNAAYNDFCRYYEDDEILQLAYVFYFCDEDAPEGKIWHYMKAFGA